MFYWSNISLVLENTVTPVLHLYCVWSTKMTWARVIKVAIDTKQKMKRFATKWADVWPIFLQGSRSAQCQKKITDATFAPSCAFPIWSFKPCLWWATETDNSSKKNITSQLSHRNLRYTFSTSENIYFIQNFTWTFNNCSTKLLSTPFTQTGI